MPSPIFPIRWARSIPWPSLRAGARGRRAHAGRCGAERRASADRCAGAGLRFSGLLRPQDVWADRNRRALRSRRNSGSYAALARRRRNDRQRRLWRKAHLRKRRIVSKPARQTSPARSASLRRSITSMESDARQFSNMTRNWRAMRSIALDELPGTRVFGPAEERGALVGFVMEAAHPHDLTTFADQYGLALRGGHHCNQPLMRRFGLPGTTRASFYFYNTMEEIDRMIEILHKAARFFS